MKKNYTRITFCPGPGAFIPEWVEGQTEFFGRGDFLYKKTKSKTISWLKKISGQPKIMPIAGSGTTAGIVAFNTFLNKKVCVIKTGYYSDRWYNYLNKTKLVKKELDLIFVLLYKYQYLKLKKNLKDFHNP